MTTTTPTVALAELAPGDLFRIDGGRARRMIRVHHDEMSAAVRIDYRDAHDPRVDAWVILGDVSEHEFTRAGAL